jgi:DNA (cytosine-5)-methyltransferase 1
VQQGKRAESTFNGLLSLLMVLLSGANHFMRRAKQKNIVDNGLPIAAVDLFCGAGGLTRGLLNAGVKVVAGYDIDGVCQFAYEQNNQPAVFKSKSVAEITGKQLSRLYPKQNWRVLVGCAPCTPFSKYTQGLDAASHEKWGLLYHFSRLISELKPHVVSMENVPQLQQHAVYDDFVAALGDLKYHVSTKEVYCPDYGIAQNRTRLVLFASKLGPISIIPPTHDAKEYATVKSAIGGLPRLKAGGENGNDPLHRCSQLSPTNLKRIKHSKPGGTWRDWPEELVAKCHKKKKGKSYPSVYGRMKWNEPSPTITTQFYGFGNGRFGHPTQNRALSLREGAILQSFPPDYEFVESGTDQGVHAIGRMIGNAVPVRLGEIVGKSIETHVRQYEQ